MGSSVEAFYDEYWGSKGNRSPDTPKFTLAEAQTYWKIWDSFYRNAKKGVLVDLGCGEGDFLETTKERYGFEKGIGLDVSSFVMASARKQHPQLEFHVCDAEFIPLPDQSADFVQSISVLEHVLNPGKVLREVARILKPGGFFACYTTDFNLPKQLIIALFYWERYFDPMSPHIRYFKRQTLVPLLNSAGLQEVHYKWHRSYYGLMPHGMCHVSRKGTAG